MRASAALASGVLLALAIRPYMQTPVLAATSSSTGAVTGAIFDLTPDSASDPLPGTAELLTQHRRLVASQRVRAGHSFRLIAAPGR